MTAVFVIIAVIDIIIIPYGGFFDFLVFFFFLKKKVKQVAAEKRQSWDASHSSLTPESIFPVPCKQKPYVMCRCQGRSPQHGDI